MRTVVERDGEGYPCGFTVVPEGGRALRDGQRGVHGARQVLYVLWP